MTADSLKVALVISNMGPGGAERVVSHLSGYWVRKGWQVVLITLSGKPSFYPLSDRVEQVNLDLMSVSRSQWQGAANNVGRIIELRRVIKAQSPDVVISFMDKTNVLVLFATRSLGIPAIVSERTFPGSYKLNPPWKTLIKLSYRFAFRVIAVTEAMKIELERRGTRRVAVIPNPVLPPPDRVARSAPRNNRVLMAAGRLEHLKGFDILIESFSALHQQHPDWVLVIAGSGELKDELERMVLARGISDKTRFPGTVTDMAGHLQGVDIFVLSSRFEGFPNVLVEAMAAGRAVVATDCKSGPGEIIEDDENGLLVPTQNTACLGRALDLLMADSELRRRLGDNARKVVATYALDKVMHQWNQIVHEAIAA
jgi:GalNAc-alpha-(1->4)-GalNAc-alpha-(1->3)-diNAcBac-PP-undecaprenol alpha-1,4-N-acetyl-D-galactosaminyltransferase